jgi:outer membrane immunogenic protein
MRILAAIGGLLAASSLAWGADLPVAPPGVVYVPGTPIYNWTGFYIGVNGGWGYASGKTTDTIVGGPLGGVTASPPFSINRVVGGGQFGANYQINQYVFGIEGDFDWSGQSSKFTGVNAISNFTESVKLPWVATVRGRVGIAIDGALGALLYGTAGVAFTHASASVTTAALGTILNTSSTNVGWTAGLGGEAAFAQNWTARIEYLYIGTDVKFSGPLGIGGTMSQTTKVSDNLFRVGINFKYP